MGTEKRKGKDRRKRKPQRNGAQPTRSRASRHLDLSKARAQSANPGENAKNI